MEAPTLPAADAAAVPAWRRLRLVGDSGMRRAREGERRLRRFVGDLDTSWPLAVAAPLAACCGAALPLPPPLAAFTVFSVFSSRSAAVFGFNFLSGDNARREC